MVQPSSPQPSARPAEQMTLRRVGMDDWANVRYVHASAFRILAGGDCEPAEADAFAAYVRSQDYADRLQSENLYAGWIDGELVGTAGWTPADDSGALARITSVFVRPLFTRLGVGRRLALDAEARARAAGLRGAGLSEPRHAARPLSRSSARGRPISGSSALSSGPVSRPVSASRNG
jgi:GNAT superfamily N-acetyltransferase